MADRPDEHGSALLPCATAARSGLFIGVDDTADAATDEVAEAIADDMVPPVANNDAMPSHNRSRAIIGLIQSLLVGVSSALGGTPHDTYVA